MRPIQNLRRPRPPHEVDRNLCHIVLPQTVQTPQKWGFSAVTFVEGQPREPQAIAQRSLHLFEGDLPFGTIDDVVGNPRSPATCAISMPRLFRQKQVAVDQRVEITRDITKMDADHTVLLLATTTTPLPLHTGGFVALL